jgi:hypothetical protein
MILSTSKPERLGMGSSSISRRAVLVSLGSTPLTMSAVMSGSAVRVGPSPIRFYVAGTRFQRSVDGLRAGVAVDLMRGFFNGSFGYAIELGDGRRIGFVPAKIVPLVETAAVKAAWLSSVNYGTVPWKSFQVVLELG